MECVVIHHWMSCTSMTNSINSTNSLSRIDGWIRRARAPAHIRSYCVSFALPLILLSAYWATRPFPDIIASKSISLELLTHPQRMNIQLASRYLDNVIVKPGEQFSFNKTVGPRTEHRGYVAAPSYVGSQTAATAGGGICLLSSCLYQLALESGMTIDKRTAHLRTIKTVPPGLDATVWYGQSDLVFKNSSSTPLQLRTTSDGSHLKLDLLGTASSTNICPLHDLQERIDKQHLRVRVVRSIKGKDEIVSDDIYGVAGEAVR